MRSTKPHVKRWKWGGPNSAWVVEGLRDQNGRRVRKFFASRDLANEWLLQRRPELNNQGRAALTLTDSQRVDAVRALSILAPFGASLTTAAAAFAERTKLLSRSVSFAELRTEVESAKKADGRSEVYLHDLHHRLRRAGEVFDERLVASIESCEIDDWLRDLGLSPTSRHNYRKVLRTAFEYAVTRGYLPQNPVVKTASVTIQHSTPGILSADEILALLEASDPQIIPSIALAAFAGLRDAEIGRMTWDRIDLNGGHIKVDAAIAKTSSRRIVPISDNLHAWLAPHWQHTGPVRPTFRVGYRLMCLARKAAVTALETKDRSSANLVSWPRNALRHSFASYRMALIGNPVQVAEECGHSVQIMKQHYRELVTKDEALAWFSVMPQESSAKVVNFRSATRARA